MSGSSMRQFDWLTGDQIRSIERDFKAGKMTAKQLAEHWGVEVDTINRALEYRAKLAAKK